MDIDTSAQTNCQKHPFTQETLKERVKLLFGASNTAVLGSLVVAALFGWLVGGHIENNLLLFCFSYIVLVSLLRLAAAQYFFRCQNSIENWQPWATFFALITCFSSLGWGLVSWFLLPESSIPHQAMAMVLLAGVASISIQTLGWSRVAVFSTVILCLLPLSAKLLMLGGQIHQFMALVTLIYAGLILKLANSTHHTLIDSLNLSLEKSALANRLAKAKGDTETLNQTLKKEVAERTQLTMELIRANEAKSRFLSHMSHELRTPMNAIVGFSQILDHELSDSDIQHTSYAKEILTASDHLLKLIDDVLDLSKIDAGKIDLNILPTPLKPVLSEAISMVKPVTEAQNITINESDIANVNYWISGDEVRLKQVMINLLSNATKYNRPAGSIDISLKTLPGNKLRISVTDTGVGIAQHQQQRIFEPFERVTKDHNVIQGAGIGLSISKQLIELMDGSIGMVSSPNQGSTFWIDLNLHQTGSSTDASQIALKSCSL